MKVDVMNQQSSMMAESRAPRAKCTADAAFIDIHGSARCSRRGGFTLVELVVVMAIIGIILTFILVAGMDAARRSEERATQSLITKLDAGVSDRVEALLQVRPDYATAHASLAQVYNGAGNFAGITRAGNRVVRLH